MIIPDKELEDEINKLLLGHENYINDSSLDYHADRIENETFYIEFINYLVKRGLKIPLNNN